MISSSAIEDHPYQPVRARCVELLHHARSAGQADVRALDWNGQAAVLKDFNDRPAWLKFWYARRMVAREVAALRSLEGMAGVPRVLATAGPLAYVMERLDAARLPHSSEPPPPPSFWVACRAMVDDMHARGVAHGDLRRKNILMGSRDAAPHLIDFATAWHRRGFFQRFMFHRARTVDRVTFARIKQSYAPEAMDAVDLRWLAETPWWLRLGRFLKKNVYKWRKPRVLRRRVKRRIKRIRKMFRKLFAK